MSEEELERADDSRRDFLKKSLAAGAVVWAAPAVTSLPGGRVWGQTGSPCPTPAGPCVVTATGLILTASAPLNVNLTLGEAPDPCVIAANFPGLLTADTICGVTDDTVCTARGFAEDLDLTVGPLSVQAVVLEGTASVSGDCPPCSTTGAATIVGLVINGSPITIPPDPCNDTIALPGLVSVTLGEQTCSGDTLTVNALHVHVGPLPIVGTEIDLIVGQAMAGRAGCDCTVCT